MNEKSPKKLPDIDNLIIDFGVVLCDVDMNACVEPFAKLGFHGVEKLLTLHLQSGLFGDADIGKVSAAQFCDGVRRISGNADASDAEITAAWLGIMRGIPQYKIELLKELKKQYRLFLLSNMNEMIWTRVKADYFRDGGGSVEDYFEKLYLSYELKMMKPDPKIMQYILDDVKIDPRRTMLIDDAAPNCAMAETFGMKSYAPKPEEDWSHIFE